MKRNKKKRRLFLSPESNCPIVQFGTFGGGREEEKKTGATRESRQIQRQYTGNTQRIIMIRIALNS